MDLGESRLRPMEFMEALKVEREKILVFQRELPLSLQLVTEAIQSCRKQMLGDEDGRGPCNTSPVLEEFIPLRPSLSSESEESRHPHQPDAKLVEKKKPEPDWMRSAQLWSQEPEPVQEMDLPLIRPVAVNLRKLGGAFHPFEKDVPVLPRPAPAASSSVENVATPSAGCRSAVEKDSSLSQSQRKARRSWSPELHRRFLHALQQLGGSHTATPKQIRELMKVDGLTNDEVKSHLQKYRLHTRRPPPTVQSSSNSTGPHAAQFVVVGGMWVNPPPEYAAAAAAAAAAASQPAELNNASLHGMYPPTASTEHISPLQHQHHDESDGSPVALHSEGRSSQGGSNLADDGATASASPTCSSSQTTTVSMQM